MTSSPGISNSLAHRAQAALAMEMREAMYVPHLHCLNYEGGKMFLGSKRHIETSFTAGREKLGGQEQA